MARYLEDLKPGQAYESRRHTITQDEIVKFAREFDPQPFHTDPEAAKTSFFGKLIASGWHTAALTMKMLTEADIDIAGGIIGAGMEELALAGAARARRHDSRARRDSRFARVEVAARDRDRSRAHSGAARRRHGGSGNDREPDRAGEAGLGGYQSVPPPTSM